jgi:hypothetical protein
MRRTNNLAFLNRDRGYRFTDRDPVLEEICNIITQSGKSAYEISELTASESHNTNKISANTISNWLNGKTKKPQNYTVTWVGYVLGYRRGWTKL